MSRSRPVEDFTDLEILVIRIILQIDELEDDVFLDVKVHRSRDVSDVLAKVTPWLRLQVPRSVNYRDFSLVYRGRTLKDSDSLE